MSELENIVPYSCQTLDDDDIKAVVEVMQEQFITQGPKVDLFEKKIAKQVDAEFAVSVNSATSALHLCCLSLGVKKNDIVWTVPNSFVASANCALYCDAKIDFVDIDKKTRNISLDLLEEKLLNSQKNNKLPKVIIPVHFSGNPVNIERLSKILKKFGDIKIIEDASHALGAISSGHKVGSCQFSDLTVFSFHPVKIITTAEGGMITTNNSYLAEKIMMLRSHGIERNSNNFYPNKLEVNKNPIYYEQHYLGYNYRMPDLLAALGISQSKKLKDFTKKRNDIAIKYNNNFVNSGIKLPKIQDGDLSSYHLYVIEVESNRNIVLNSLRQKGIMASIHYIPIHYHPYYQNLGFKFGDFPNSENYYKNCISIPIYPMLSWNKQKFVINSILELI